MACIYARARQAEKAVKQLQIFASNFCSANSFHLNGDQKGGEYSSFTYRPFTLEGNFAFAQGVHELLIQSRDGRIEVFPAVPAQWKDVSFTTLKTEGAFLVSASREGGVVSEVTVKAEQGGKLVLKLPFKTFFITNLQKKYELANGILEVRMKKGETITIKNGYE
jgi:alpha-L-fucosidase 2